MVEPGPDHRNLRSTIAVLRPIEALFDYVHLGGGAGFGEPSAVSVPIDREPHEFELTCQNTFVMILSQYGTDKWIT